MKQEKRRQRTIRLLLDATKELIRDKGCQAITMKDIMERTALSKGAIFHYVSSKDELFAWVLEERLEETDRQFRMAADRDDPTFEEPMSRIANGLLAFENADDVTNRVLAYLLGREEDAAVAAALLRYYERTVQISRQWIEAGQRAGVIAASVDGDRSAEMFVLLTLGLRIRTTFRSEGPSSFTAADLSAFISQSLHAKEEEDRS